MVVITLRDKSSFASNHTPTICPICHHHITADVLYGIFNKVTHNSEILFQCNNHKCQHLFIGIYNDDRPSSIIALTPIKMKPLELNDKIKNISPSFYKIYTQALEAEALGLDEITGVGLRKALEFLIKDYCISKNPTKEEDIKKTLLMPTINTYMSEASKLRSVATKAVWLGNDETHYVRKWEDKDISHLKMLIDLTLHWIESELLTDEFEQSMSK
ncbi:MAG: DUF4145 domain-containing protein [Campylobacteraceae bacterium]|nr:DUF4145 domain-containing protein [Campylobacteraceae bacterium]